MPFSLTPLTAPHYGSRAGIESLAGVNNVAQFADLDGGTGTNTAAIATQIDVALTDADKRIVKEFAVSSATIPASTSAYYGQLATVANYFALVYLYRPRSLNDENAQAFRDMWEKYAKDELADVIWAIDRDTCCSGTPKLVVSDPSIAADLRATVGASVWF